jgi:hypothetical protein
VKAMHFYEKFHFYLKIEKVDVGKKTLLKCCCIETVNEEFKYMYKLRTTTCIRSSAELSSDDIIYSNVICREYVQPNDILYAFYPIKKEKDFDVIEQNNSIRGNIRNTIYGEFLQNMDDIVVLSIVLINWNLFLYLLTYITFGTT